MTSAPRPPVPGAAASVGSRLKIVLALTTLVLVVQVVGGLVSGSLALLADAGHVLTDVGGLTLALVAARLARRPPTQARTFGWQRAEILAALVNAVLVALVGGVVLVEAVRRWAAPPDVQGPLVLAVAVLGGAVNGIGLAVLHRGRRDSLNLRGAYLEVLSDLLGSVAVVVAAVVVTVTGESRADVLASVVIGLMILPRAWSLLRAVVDVLLEATPPGVDLEAVRQHVRDVAGVLDVHDLHAWTITSGVPVLSAHVVVDDDCLTQGRSGEVLDRLASCLEAHFDVEHCTFQLEPLGHQAHEPVHHA